MKEKNNFFKKFISSIYDLSVFSNYAKEGFLRAILYALLLTLMLGGIKGLATGYRFNESITKINKVLTSNKYQFAIRNGVLNINESPIKIEEPHSLIYLDKERDINNEDNLNSLTEDNNVVILFLKNGIIVKNSIDEYKMDYSNPYVKSILNNYILNNKFNIYKVYIFIFVIITTIVMTFFNLLINCLIIVAFTSLITIFMKMVVKYSALCSLIIYATTLPLIIKVILEIINPRINFDTVFIVGTLLYVIFILMYIKSEIIENIKMGKIK